MRSIVLFFILATSTIIVHAQCPHTEAIDFTATDIDGNEWNLFETLDSGKFVLIDFFKVSCGACELTAPIVNESFLDFGCNEHDVIFLSVNNTDTNEECEEFEENFGTHYPTISGMEGGGMEICDDYDIPAWPTVILIAPDHQIIEQNIWPITSTEDISQPLLESGCNMYPCYVHTEENLELSINTYPNPVQEYLNISLSKEKTGIIRMQLLDICGRNLMEKLAENDAGESFHMFDMGKLPAGLYFLRVHKDNKELAMKKVLKIKK